MFTLTFGDYEFPNQTFLLEQHPDRINIQSKNILRKGGSLIPSPFQNEKQLSIKGIIHNTSEAISYQQLLDMQEALLDGEQKFRYRSGKYINSFTKDIKFKYKEGLDNKFITIDVKLIAQDPYYEDDALTTEVENHTGGTNSFDLAIAGNIDSDPFILITASGGTISALSLQNVTDDSAIFEYGGTIPNGATLSVDTNNLEVLLAGVDGLSDFSGDFFNLIAGSTNSFIFVGITSTLSIQYRPRYSS